MVDADDHDVLRADWLLILRKCGSRKAEAEGEGSSKKRAHSLISVARVPGVVS